MQTMQLFMFGFVDTLHGCEGVFLFPAFSVISLHRVRRLTLKRLINPTEKNQHMYEAISRTLELRDTKDI